LTGPPKTSGIGKIGNFPPLTCYGLKTVQGTGRVAREVVYEDVCDLSNGVISSDLDRLLKVMPGHIDISKENLP